MLGPLKHGNMCLDKGHDSEFEWTWCHKVLHEQMEQKKRNIAFIQISHIPQINSLKNENFCAVTDQLYCKPYIQIQHSLLMQGTLSWELSCLDRKMILILHQIFHFSVKVNTLIQILIDVCSFNVTLARKCTVYLDKHDTSYALGCYVFHT
jgi:hypothetical protein